MAGVFASPDAPKFGEGLNVEVRIIYAARLLGSPDALILGGVVLAVAKSPTIR